ncbi:MAG: AtpZ/AtpI family protein, partial [Candidatus Hydrogenedentes bacterium]|nr:AtpZ/AtpI family protein [Candidatus Hydrogenedentota bacterium]
SEAPEPSDMSWAATFVLVAQVGLVVVVPATLGAVGGFYADHALQGNGAILLGGIALGVAAGLYGAFCLMAKQLG